MKITLHPMTPDETGFVFSTFEASIREASTYVSGMRPADVTALLYALIERGWQVQVAERVDVPELAIGWICTGPARGQVAWMTVKPFHRGNGVARQMLAAAGVSRWGKITSPFSPNRTSLIYRPPREGEEAPKRAGFDLVFRPYLVGVVSSKA